MSLAALDPSLREMMTFKPDYGLKLFREGCTSKVDHYFYDFRLYSLSVLGRGHYTTMVEKSYDGELHALSLDFNQDQLDQILAKADPQLTTYIQAELGRDPISPRTIDFDGEVAFRVRARLGQIQKVQHETFVPFVAQEIIL